MPLAVAVLPPDAVAQPEELSLPAAVDTALADPVVDEDGKVESIAVTLLVAAPDSTAVLVALNVTPVADESMVVTADTDAEPLARPEPVAADADADGDADADARADAEELAQLVVEREARVEPDMLGLGVLESDAAALILGRADLLTAALVLPLDEMDAQPEVTAVPDASAVGAAELEMRAVGEPQPVED